MTDPAPIPRDPLLPERFGEYRVVALLGEGGMGTVYEAEQQHPKRRVALKVIRPGLASAEVLRRFEHEAAVLARLQHPGIAQIHEAGTFTATGGVKQPYFAMELVRGLPLTEYASARGLDTRQRLELVVRICEAVEHAHQRGIVHRDLKPANILVDESGQPKILDFGLARLTDSDVQMTMHTDLGQLVGTLPYMSPEQAAGEPDEMDTRSDVYALGVIAYELLSGRLPHDLHRRLLHEAVRVIREEMPSRLSSIDRSLRGDVETIVGKALEKDKARRYQSAGELASDIQRYLKNEAISARPASTWYQLRKFARRNRVLVGGVLATFLALGAGLVVSATQYVRAADARDLAEDAGEEARAINTFLLEMLGSADLTKLGREAKVAQALDAASAVVGSSFADRPRVELGVREILARTYLSLGMFEEAEPHAQRTLELATQLDGPDGAWRATGLQRVATCRAGRGDNAGAESLLREAVGIRERLYGPEDSVTLDLRMDLANQLRLLEQFEESEAIYRAVLAIRRASPGSERALQVTCNSLAVLLHTAGRPAEAEPLYREAAELAERQLGPDDPDSLIARFNLASVLESLGDAEQAEAIMAETLPRMRAVFGDRHLTTAIAMRMLGRLYLTRGRLRDAVPLLEEAVAVVQRVQGERAVDVARFKNSLAIVQLNLMDYPAAAETLRTVVDIYVEQGMIEHVETIGASTSLALALNNSGRAEEAEALYRRIIDDATRVLGPDDKATIIAMNSLGVLLQGSGRFAEAEPLLLRALESLERAYPPEDLDTAITMHNVMRLQSQLGRGEEAAALAPDLVARFERVFGPRHPRTAQAKASAAFILRDAGRRDEAEELCRSSLEIRREVYGEQHVTVGLSLRLLGELRLDRGDVSGAHPLLSDALSILEATNEASALAACRSQLGECLAKLGRYGEAEPLLLEGQRGIEAARDATAAQKRRAIERLVELYSAWNAAEPGAERGQQLAAWQARLDAPAAPN
ncbi:MAG: tetratricopeptide repeat protein [Planctomycetota bacterium]|nr:MAG: tetratricopeptide repeat protein [Planctomycetota bacterium]